MTWDDEAATWDHNPAVRRYALAAFETTKQHLHDNHTSLSGSRVLDFGCGTGLLTAAMAGEAASVIGLDPSASMVDQLRHKALANVTALTGVLGDHDLGHFDLITASSVCAFLEDYPGMVKQLVQRLLPGGWFVQFDWELDLADAKPFGLSRSAVRLALLGAGLVEVEVRTAFVGYTLPPILGVGQAATPAPCA